MNLIIDTEQRTLTVQHDSDIHSFKLFNQDGFLVESNFEKNTYNFSHLPKGTYTVCVTDKESRFFSEKFVV
ncbi:MAG: hypothetical protein J0L69_10495 [Bacteroidetes bacterium]|nr:hypothetical protein [Bacteroidota bacterium]